DSAWSLLRVVQRSLKQEPLEVTPRIPVVHGGEKSTCPVLHFAIEMLWGFVRMLSMRLRNSNDKVAFLAMSNMFE
ncbi:MAG: hypothetical protein AAGI01_14935, partial [Myxococcota bacterium]